MHTNKCTLKFWSLKKREAPCLLEMVQLPALIVEWKRDKDACIFLRTHFYVYFNLSFHTHTLAYTSYCI